MAVFSVAVPNIQCLIGLSQEKCIGGQTVMWFTVPVCVYGTEKRAGIVTMSEQRQKRVPPSGTLHQQKIDKTNFAVPLLFMWQMISGKCSAESQQQVQSVWKRAVWKIISWGRLCAQNLNKSWDWILILTPCSDSRRLAVRSFQLFQFECQRAELRKRTLSASVLLLQKWTMRSTVLWHWQHG